MTAILGNIFLWLSLVFATFQFAISYNNIIIFFYVFIFSFLTFSHIISDFSVLNVFQNSHTTKPLLYKISGVWGNHEGSMLLWILVLTIFNYFISRFYNNSNFNFITKALETQALIIIGFILFTIFTSNPFERIFPIPENG